jgi:hypothetical protein
MKTNKLFIVAAGISAFVAVGMTMPYQKERKNLKVLPKGISDVKLDSIMASYNVALGVDCNFCHAPAKGQDTLDFTLDTNPMKGNALHMMEMAIELNTKYFYFDKAVKPVYLNTVHCKTCHRGEAIPAEH